MTQQSNTSSPTLLNLPPELRQHILSFLLEACDTPVPSSTSQISAPLLEQRGSSCCAGWRVCLRALVLTCHQLHKESMSVFGRINLLAQIVTNYQHLASDLHACGVFVVANGRLARDFVGYNIKTSLVFQDWKPIGVYHTLIVAKTCDCFCRIVWMTAPVQLCAFTISAGVTVVPTAAPLTRSRHSKNLTFEDIQRSWQELGKCVRGILDVCKICEANDTGSKQLSTETTIDIDKHCKGSNVSRLQRANQLHQESLLNLQRSGDAKEAVGGLVSALILCSAALKRLSNARETQHSTKVSGASAYPTGLEAVALCRKVAVLADLSWAYLRLGHFEMAKYQARKVVYLGAEVRFYDLVWEMKGVQEAVRKASSIDEAAAGETSTSAAQLWVPEVDKFTWRA
ncbi:MAG: hypothetical protein Q9164_002086 [Protoblastenia rupestris]